jgi:heparanase 1
MTVSRTLIVATLTAPLFSCIAIGQSALQPKTMPRIAQVDQRYVSYNVEAVEVTGGRFWKRYPNNSAQAASPSASTDPYQYRAPIDLSNPKLRKLTAALGPSYLRVSGTWRNSTFFQDDDAPAMATAPEGYKSILTRAQWKGVVDFSRAVNADIVTSFAMSAGTRDANGVWTSDQAKALFDYTSKIGGHIVAAEFMNEPTYANVGGAPTGYDAAAFAKDVKEFNTFLRAASPDTLFLGLGSIGEGVLFIEGMPMPKIINTEDMLKATGPIFDVFSYHFYTTLAQRCVGNAGLSWEKVLTPAYLNRNPAAWDFYAKLRDAYMPGKAIWLTETGEAGCGGDRWGLAVRRHLPLRRSVRSPRA